MQRHYYLHFLVIFTLFGATERFSSLYETISGSSDQLKPYELLQGSQNKSLEASEELYNIAKMIKSNQTLSNIFNQANIRPMRRALRDHPMGNEIDQEISSYLETYGYRSISEDISSKLWIEDPAYPLMTLKSYVLGPERDFQAELLEKKVSASNQFSDLVDLAKSQKRIDLEDLDDSLQQARKLWPLREDHAYYIDQQSNAFARLLILKFANSLVKNNVIPNPNDIFHLELDEIKQAVADPSVGLTTTIEQRKLDFNNFRREVPPRFLGTMYTCLLYTSPSPRD